jgi:hypothetical protein
MGETVIVRFFEYSLEASIIPVAEAAPSAPA